MAIGTGALIAAGADLEARPESGETALIYAVWSYLDGNHNHTEVVTLLIAAGATIRGSAMGHHRKKQLEALSAIAYTHPVEVPCVRCSWLY